MIQRGPIWDQLEASMVLQIIEKPFFFLIGRKSWKAFGNALEHPLGRLGKPLGTFWGAGESFGDALGALGGAMGGLGDAGRAFLGEPYR